MTKLITYLSLLLFLLCTIAYAQTNDNHRVIVLTDIEADPDDSQSLIRLLLYSNQIDIKGLVATTSVWHKNSVEPQSIIKIINAYQQVHANLIQHESGYPSAKQLLALVTSGLPLYGMQGVGDKHDSAGSELILKELEKDDQRPLWISVWGGVNTLAQTLTKIRNTKSASAAKALIAKLRVYTISDQDDSGIWIRNNFPELFYIVSPGDHYESATWTGINAVIKGIDNQSISNQWLVTNIQQGHGPLGAKYPDVAWGVEGDTPAFLSLIPNGLNNAEQPQWGGWGGRYQHYLPDFSLTKEGSSDVVIAAETRAIWTNANDKVTPYITSEYGRDIIPSSTSFNSAKATLWRWRDEFQHDFAARIDWTTQTYQQANHPPVPKLVGDDRFTVTSGQGFSLDASTSTDPDGDSLSFLWFDYPEAGSYKKTVAVGAANNAHAIYVTAPQVDSPKTVHIILKVTDKGSPTLSRYKRIIVTVLPLS